MTNEDYEPVFGKNYFYKDEKPHESFQKMSILIPMYNETTKEYKRTLADLHECILELNKVGCGYVHILTILDGWSVTHKTMKDYLQIMYPQVANELNSISASTNEIETYIVQKIDEKNEPTWVKISDKMSLKISFIIKKDNRRKHNSHAWFLETFAQEMNSDYIFLTDCGTRFDRKCLLNLFLGISKDDNCSAISGRQRVMTNEQQGTSDNFRGFMYRSMQCYDYESSLASYVGAFSIFGMLPVIPGPCGMYRLAAICNRKKRDELLGTIDTKDFININCQNNNQICIDVPKDVHNPNHNYIDAIDFYIKTVSLNPDETGMLLGSLLLAEDRILSYAAVLKTEKRFHTKYEPSACFYFEAETSPTVLLQQRRRWINGTIAGYLWLLQHISILFNSKVSFMNKALLTTLIFSQMMMFCVMAIGIAILTVALRYPLLMLFGVSRMIVEIIIGGYFLLYVVFVWHHASPNSKGPKLNRVLFDLFTIINVGIAGLLMYGFVVNVMQYELIYNVVILGFNMVMPIILAALHDLISLKLMITNIIQYVLLLPTFSVILSVYAFSRLWELTWGNRPSDKLHTLQKKKSEEELQIIKKRLQFRAQFVAWFLVFLNLIMGAAFAYMQAETLFIVALQIFIFVWSSVQMLLSLLYFITHGIMSCLSFLKRLLTTCSTSRKNIEIKQKSKKNNQFNTIVNYIEQSMNNKL